MPASRPSPKTLLNQLRLVVQAENDFVDLRYLLDEIELIVEKRPTEDRNDRFWRVNRERAQSCSLTSHEEQRFHIEAR